MVDRPSLLALLALLLGSLPAHDATAQARLGSISFPTSGSTAARARFTEGVLFMHSFEYAPAARQFRAAQEFEPGFAMAYWGEAMTYNHPIWNQRDQAAAVAAGDRKTAARAYDQLRQVWDAADPGLPGLEEVRRFVASSR